MDRRDFLEVTALGAAAALLPARPRAAKLSPEQVEARARELVAAMTLEEKTTLMAGRLDPKNRPRPGHMFPNPTPGCPRLGIPGFQFMDGPAGVRYEKVATCFPAGIGRGASFDTALEERVGEAIGYEGRALGANLFGGVVVNLLRHPRWGRSQETFGEDPHHLGAMGAAVIRGVQKHMMATAKHYAGNSIENTRGFVDVRMSERTLREIYTPHFKACVDAGVAAIMSAYNKLNGEYCSHNQHLLREILKDDWKFQGLVMSDFGAVHGTVPAIKAGLDLEMPQVKYYGPKLRAAVEDGRVPVAAIDEACLRLVRTMLRFGVFEPANLDRSAVAGPAHAALSRESAEKSFVLLKNERAALPLDPTGVRKLALIGPFASRLNLAGTGSSRMVPPYLVTPEDGIRELAPKVELVSDEGDKPWLAAQAAAGADAALVFVGLTEKDESEGLDRRHLSLSVHHEELILTVAAANPRTIVVLSTGGALATENWIDRVPAALVAWYPGMEGGNALARTLFGLVNPSGKLPMVWPKSEAQLPSFNNFSLMVNYDSWHGYRYCDKKGLEPRFHFGHGLSYTRFAYANMRVKADTTGIRAMVDLTNIGGRPGDEIVFLFIGAPGKVVERAVKELKGFARVTLNPGETRTISFMVRREDLAYWDEAGHCWAFEPGEYRVYIGGSSRNTDLLNQKLNL